MTSVPHSTGEKKVKRPRLAIDGVLLLDKAVGISSNDALIAAKRVLWAAKAGHTGTLDPFATGLLPLCFGEATKFSQDLLEADKTYETLVHLGIRTETGDTEGAVVEQKPVPNFTEAEIEAVLAQFLGPISQVPPMYSALKRDGKPLYEYARQGITLEREARAVIIHDLQLLSWQAPMLRLRVTCSKGTYIRVLGEDIGQALGVGAHLQELRRVAVAHLSLAQAITLEQLREESEPVSKLAPVDALLSTFPAVYLPGELAQRFMHGQRLALGRSDDIAAGRVRVYQHSGTDIIFGTTVLDAKLLGTAQLAEFGVLAPERLISNVAGAVVK
ncbi:MAG: tRNA pseudouridine(55) synthase TruB [Burkholderiales bacterium]|nr:tRNA pseudouridine(55) synthase TruB [Burkholderiales bacterium]